MGVAMARIPANGIQAIGPQAFQPLMPARPFPASGQRIPSFGREGPREAQWPSARRCCGAPPGRTHGELVETRYSQSAARPEPGCNLLRCEIVQKSMVECK